MIRPAIGEYEGAHSALADSHGNRNDGFEPFVRLESLPISRPMEAVRFEKFRIQNRGSIPLDDLIDCLVRVIVGVDRVARQA